MQNQRISIKLTAECSTIELPGNGPSYGLHYKGLGGLCAIPLSPRFGSVWFQQGNFFAIANAILSTNGPNYRL
jgi:hypothetical protein